MTEKPNILFFHVDNLGMGELGCYGGGILRGADTKRMHYFHEMFHAEGGHRVAAQELIALHIDMRVRRVAPFPADRQAVLADALRARAGMKLPEGVGRRITMPR